MNLKQDMSDETLLQKPDIIVSQLNMFLCMYAAHCENVNMSYIAATKLKPSGAVLAINSNHSHLAQPGYEALLKQPKTKPVGADEKIIHNPDAKVRKNRSQTGDGTCFNSALEPVIHVRTLAAPAGADLLTIQTKAPTSLKKLKFFATTGHTQVPNVRRQDLSDGREAVANWVDFLNSSRLGTGQTLVRVVSEGPVMLNYNFSIRLESPRLLIKLNVLAKYLFRLERRGVNTLNPDALANLQAEFATENLIIVVPPAPLTAVELVVEDLRFTCCMLIPPECGGAEYAPVRLKVFQSGKVNLLGLSDIHQARRIHLFVTEIFEKNWRQFLALKPQRNIIAPGIASPLAKFIAAYKLQLRLADALARRDFSEEAEAYLRELIAEQNLD